MNKTLHKFPKEQTKRVYFPEYAKEFKNLEGPGPALYQYETYKSSFNIEDKRRGTKFTKVRKIYTKQLYIG